MSRVFTSVRRLIAALVVSFLPVLGWVSPASAEQAAEQKLPAILTAKPRQPGEKDDDLRKLLVARYNAAVAEIAAFYRDFLKGRGTFETFVPAAQRLVESGIELSDTPAEQIALREQFLELAKEVEKNQLACHEAGRIPDSEVAQARYLRLDAEIRLLRAKRKADQAKPK